MLKTEHNILMKGYNMSLQKQKEDSPLILRPDEIIIKLDRFNELCSIENKYLLLKREMK